MPCLWADIHAIWRRGSAPKANGFCYQINLLDFNLVLLKLLFCRPHRDVALLADSSPAATLHVFSMLTADTKDANLPKESMRQMSDKVGEFKTCFCESWDGEEPKLNGEASKITFLEF